MKRWVIFLIAAIVIVGLTVYFTLTAKHEDGVVQIPSMSDTKIGETWEYTETKNGSAYTVTFYSNDNRILWIDTVPEKGSATPPVEPEMEYGNVFSKWDSDFTSVTKDLEIRPECQSITGKKNVFAMAGAYGKNGDYVIVPFRLCGDVCLCGFDLTVTYDPTMLQLESLFNEDGAIVYNDETPGEINMNYVSIKDVEADVDICSFKFKVLAEKGEIPVAASMTSIYAGNDDESMYVPDYEFIPANVYVYQ